MAQSVMLEASLDHQASGRLVSLLAEATGAVDLDGAAVVHVGGLAAQLLLHSRRAAPADRPVRLVNPSSACVEGLARLGIDTRALA